MSAFIAKPSGQETTATVPVPGLSAAQLRIDFMQLFEGQEVFFMVQWHLRKQSSMPEVCVPYHRNSLCLARGSSLDYLSEIDQLLTINLALGFLPDNIEKVKECLKNIKTHYLVRSGPTKVIEYFQYLYERSNFLSEDVQELYSSASDPKLLCTYCNHMGRDALLEKNYTEATELYLESIEYNPTSYLIVIQLINYIYLDAPAPWFSIEKAKSLLISTMDIAKDDSVVLAILKNYFVQLFLSPEYWFVKEHIAVGKKLLANERNELGARREAALEKAAELGYVEDDLKCYRRHAGSLVYNVNGVDIRGKNAWYLVLVDPAKRGEFLASLKGNTTHLEDYGLLLNSAYGMVAPDEAENEIKERYRIGDDAVVTHPLHFRSLMMADLNAYTAPHDAG